MKYKIAYNSRYGGYELSQEAKEWLKRYDIEDPEYLSRHSPILIRCIEQLGELVNAPGTHIEIAEISSRIYKIENCDGKETVIEGDEDWIIID